MAKQEQKKGNQNNKSFKIPEDAKKLAKLNFKKFKKENEDYYDGKKDLKNGYYGQILEYLPDSINLIIRYGHLQDVQETKEAIYEKLTDNGFIKYLKKEIKHDYEFNNMLLLPNIIYDIIGIAKRQVEADKAENPDAKVEYDLDDLIEISRMLLKKKIKKLNKSGIDDNVAFDILSIIPTTKILAKGQQFHIRKLFSVLYEHAKTKDIDFEKIMDVVFKDSDYICAVITYALLERKEKITTFNDSQKKLFNDITTYCFKSMEDMKKDEIHAILKAYTDSRKRDESQNKDSNRRYYISSLPESDYPKIIKAVTRMCDLDENLKKYF